MSGWTVEVTSPAERDLKRLDPQERKRVIKGVRRFAETEHGDITRLKDVKPPEWRLRVGSWRVRFAYRTEDHVLTVLRVLPRGKAYDR